MRRYGFDDEFRVAFDQEGHLVLMGEIGWREAICAECGKPIRWCLDMMSFTTGTVHRLAHAECVWMPEAFDRLRAEAQELHGDD